MNVRVMSVGKSHIDETIRVVIESDLNLGWKVNAIGHFDRANEFARIGICAMPNEHPKGSLSYIERSATSKRQ